MPETAANESNQNTPVGSDDTSDLALSAPPVADAPAAPPVVVAAESKQVVRLFLLLGAVAAVVLVVDQLTKAWALNSLVSGDRTPVLGDLLGLQLIGNPGAALSMARGLTWVLTIVAVVVVMTLIWAARKIRTQVWAVTFGLLIGGALGNLVDRMIRPPGVLVGEVVDFIAYGSWFIGNVADIAIVVAAGVVIVLVAKGMSLDGKQEISRG